MPCKLEIKKTIDKNISDKTQDDFWGFTEKEARKIAVDLNSLWGSIATIAQTTAQGGWRIIISRLDEAVNREFDRQKKAEASFERNLDFFNDDRALFEQEQKENTFLQKTKPTTSIESLNQELIDRFLKDFNITVTEYDDFKKDIGIDGVAAADLITKAIAYQKGESILPEVAYFAYNMLGKQNNKLRSELRYLINKWEKYSERFNHHANLIKERVGFIKDSKEWKEKIRDLVILDFLQEKLKEHYLNPQQFEKSLDTKWTKEDFSLWNKIMTWIENLLSFYSSKYKNQKNKLSDIGLAIADEVLNQNYEYFDYSLSEDQIQKYYKNTIESDFFAKELVEKGQNLGLVLTGSLALRKAGTVYRTADETLHDIDWVVPYDLILNNRRNQILLQEIIKNQNSNDLKQSAINSVETVKQFTWYEELKKQYPSLKPINIFYGGEHEKFQSLTLQTVINGEYYKEKGTHKKVISYYSKDKNNKSPIKNTKEVIEKHEKGDYIEGTGYVVDFFIRLKPNQDQHENYFKLWKEIMIAKLQMGRDKDFSDWKAFVPYMKSKDSFNFNYEGFRHISYESSQNNAFEETSKTSNDKYSITSNEIETESSTASPKTINLLKQFIKQIGVDVNNVKDVVVDGKRIDANGAALLMQKLIQVVEGKEAKALPEEAMHFAVAIIKQTNPKLYQQLLKEINNYNIYKQVLKDYSSVYLTKEGKPDIQKLKEEAIGKVLAETIIKQSEGFVENPENLAKVQTWWQSILDWLKGLFIKSGVDRLAMDILSGKNIGTAEDINETETFFQLSKQDRIVNQLKEVASKLEKKADGYYINGNKVPKRVTELVKGWFERKFRDKALTKGEFQKAVDDLKRENGDKGHLDFENAFKYLVDENGNVRETPLDDSEYTSQLNPDNRDMYEILRNNLKERIDAINNKAPGTKFFAELMVYNPKMYGGLGGTIDFLSVSPEGKVNIYDWKFMNLNTEKYEDVPWYKVNAWQEQMKQYKLILQNVYGVKSEDFEQTRMIPIQAVYTEGNAKNNVLPKLKSIKIGDVNVQNINEDFLLPVGLESETTGNKKIDKLLEKLNGEYKRLSEKKITEGEKASKAEALNQLFKAIRQLQIKQNLAPIVKQAQLLNKQIEQTIKKFDDWKDVNPKTASQQAINDFSNEIIVAQDMVKIYTNIDLDLAELFLDSPDEKLEEALSKTANTARKYEKLLEEKLEEFSENIIAKSENVNDFLTPEKVVKGLTKWFGTTSTIQLKSLQLLYKKASKSLGFAAQDTLDETKKLLQLKETYDKWASSKGLNVKNYFDILKKKDKNELIDEFNPEFYSTLKTKIEERDYQWIRDNVDQSAYKEKIKELLKEELERIENKTRVGTDEEINQEIIREKRNAQALFNVSTPTSPGWLLYDRVNKFPLDKWQTKEWVELNKPENKAAKDFYDYIREKNAEYKALGYIGRGQDRVFLPFVRKGLVEKLIFGGKISLGEQFLRSISIDEGDIGYGKIDPLTGKPVNSIPKYFTSEIEGELSEDLFRTMALYNEMAIKYKYVSEIEHQMEAISRVEQNKKAIRTSIFGRTEYKNGQLQTSPDNSDNAKLLDDSIKAIIYGQRFIQSETFDQLLGKIGNWGETFNKKLGIKIFPENLSDRQVSVNKVIDAFNSQFQLNTLGLNPLSATSNFFGGHAQSIINAGKWFTKSDYMSSELELFTNKLTNNEIREKFIAALEYFLPLTENYNREVAKHLSLKALSQENIQDFLMIMMRKADLNVQTVNFMSFLKNSIVVDGEIVNAREYLRNSEKYQTRYAGSKENRDKLNKEFEEDVKNLVKEKGVLSISKIEDHKLVIPGIERKSDSVLDLRRKVQSLTADALGQATAEDIRNINLTVFGKSFMIFKNWIPRLTDVRFGEMKYNSKSDAYEWGRMRTIFKYLSDDLLGSVSNLTSSLKGTDKGIEYIRELWEKKRDDYFKNTGKELEMTENQFIDLVRNNIRNQMYDTIFLLTLLSLCLALKAAAPDKDEDPAVRNQYKFLMKAADKLRDEISYFYDPTSFSSMFSTGLFPSIGLLTNFEKTFTHFLRENYYILTGNEKEQEKNFVIKYAMRSFPFTNQILGYLPMWYPDLAKELGVKMQSNYGIR